MMPSRPSAQRTQESGLYGVGGFTLIELMIVVSIAGILVTLAEPSFRGAVLKAKEAVLKQDLFTLRDAIDQYRADRGQYPPSLEELRSVGYLKRMPIDPFTKSDASWQELLAQEGGVFDVHSGTDILAQDGSPYNQW
jgi:general secretion pathway protein G